MAADKAEIVESSYPTPRSRRCYLSEMQGNTFQFTSEGRAPDLTCFAGCGCLCSLRIVRAEKLLQPQEGTITLVESRLTIGPNAHVAANVSARDVILLGQLSGNVTATGKVELRDGCDLVGDISAARPSIEESAVFRGKVEPLQGEKPAASAAKGAGVPAATSPAK